MHLLGSSTLSRTWITPFDWVTSAMVTLAVPPLSSITVTPAPAAVAVRLPPDTVLSTALPPPSITAFLSMAASILPATTWWVSTLVDVEVFHAPGRCPAS